MVLHTLFKKRAQVFLLIGRVQTLEHLINYTFSKALELFHLTVFRYCQNNDTALYPSHY